MAVGVLEVITCGCQDVMVFLLDLPAAAPGSHERHPRGIGQGGGSQAGVRRHPLPGGGRGREFAPLDQQRLVAVTQGHLVPLAVGVAEPLFPGPAGLEDGAYVAQTVEIGPPLGERGMGRGAADAEEVEAGVTACLADRLRALEIRTPPGQAPGGIAPPPARPRRAAASSPSGLSCPSWGHPHSGATGTPVSCPGATLPGVRATG